MKSRMKDLRILAIILLSLGLLLAAGCRTAPVRNVTNAPIMTVDNASPELQKVRGAIIKAGAGNGWQMNPVQDGLIVGTLNIRTHQAVVDIKYDTKTYSITYKDSMNLKYNGATIHSNYNGWITNLDNAIKRELAELK